MSYIEVLNEAVVWRSATASSAHRLNILGFEARSMTLAAQATTVNFEEKILACKSVPVAQDLLVLVNMQEVALMELSRQQLVQKASLAHEEIEEEVHQMVVTVDHAKANAGQSSAASQVTSYIQIVILHD